MSNWLLNEILAHHEQCKAVCRKLPEDYEGYGEQPRDYIDAAGMVRWGNDCSMGCRWYDRLDGDWGVCLNPASHRAGLLTFEHQGCLQFELDEEDAE